MSNPTHTTHSPGENPVAAPQEVSTTAEVPQGEARQTPINSPSLRAHVTIVSRLTTYVDLLAKIVGLVTWPALLLVAAVVFYPPLRRVADLLPEKIAQSNEIGIGGLSMKIAERARATGNAELAAIINGLSEGAIQWLLKLGDGSHRVIASNDGGTGVTTTYSYHRNPAWFELEGKKLLRADTPLPEFEAFFSSLKPNGEKIEKARLSGKQEGQLLSNSVRLTDEGQRAYKIIIGVVADMIGSKQHLPSEATSER